MNTFELKVWNDECDQVTYYTVAWDEYGPTETDRFFEKYEKTHKKAVQRLLSLLIDSIGTDHGAIDLFFNRPEDGVTGLPPHGRLTVDEVYFHYPKFPLRLYALRINESLVVLFNGGHKTASTNQDSPELNMQFQEAKIFGRRIENALHDGMIVFDEASRSLKSFNGSDEMVL